MSSIAEQTFSVAVLLFSHENQGVKKMMNLDLRNSLQRFHQPYISKEIALGVNEAMEESEIEHYVNDAMEELTAERKI